jgi:ketosteroid isomerase-like protein
VSQENVEFVEGLVGGVAGIDRETLLAALPQLIAQTCTPDIEWVEDPERADSRVYHGPDAVERSWKRWLEQWDEYGFEAERFVDCGEDVLVVSREHGRGVASGASVSSRHYAAVTIRGGKVARFREFYDEQAALKAVGLEE